MLLLKNIYDFYLTDPYLEDEILFLTTLKFIRQTLSVSSPVTDMEAWFAEMFVGVCLRFQIYLNEPVSSVEAHDLIVNELNDVGSAFMRYYGKGGKPTDRMETRLCLLLEGELCVGGSELDFYYDCLLDLEVG